MEIRLITAFDLRHKAFTRALGQFGSMANDSCYQLSGIVHIGISPPLA